MDCGCRALWAWSSSHIEVCQLVLFVHCQVQISCTLARLVLGESDGRGELIPDNCH